MKLSIVIPVFDEVQTIAEILRRIAAVSPDAEIVVVDDGSTDATREVLRSRTGATIVFHDRNAGKGAAIRTGLSYVTGEVVIVQDADLELHHIVRFNLFSRQRARAIVPHRIVRRLDTVAPAHVLDQA
jgi:glycosyltransferase involved in cell wall biosynthesis